MPYLTEKRTITTEQTVIIGCNCDNCGQALKPVDGTEVQWNQASALGSLDITLSGGYGQYVDGEATHLVWCQECLELLIKAFPSIRKKLDVSDWLIQVVEAYSKI